MEHVQSINIAELENFGKSKAGAGLDSETSELGIHTPEKRQENQGNLADITLPKRMLSEDKIL